MALVSRMNGWSKCGNAKSGGEESRNLSVTKAFWHFNDQFQSFVFPVSLYNGAAIVAKLKINFR